MSLHIYNSLRRSTEAFSSIEPGHVRMYVCGMTVYDYCHLGHARSMIAFDVVQRWLKACAYRVTYVRNITDVDDKIIKRALENQEPIRALTERMIEALHQDADALGIERPQYEPRATDHVPQMLSMIQTLEKKGLAYRAANGDVHYAVRRFAPYGQLSGKSLDELRAGERVAIEHDKQDPLDFVLWKASKATEPDDAKWESPFGLGRPGWHIECSAMSCQLLGERFDIHGGGADLQFPHHENEIAQSQGALGEGTFAKWWMHNGFIKIDNEKMSKSLGNFLTIRDILKRYDAETVRFFIVRSHYRSALHYSDVHLDDAKSALRRLYTALASCPHAVADFHARCQAIKQSFSLAQQQEAQYAILEKVLKVNTWAQASPHHQAFQAAMNDDFGTPAAVAVLFDLASQINRCQEQAQKESGAHDLLCLAYVLGLLQQDPVLFLQGRGQGGAKHEQGLSNEMIEAYIQERAQAKAQKNYARADEIREQLQKQGIVLNDSSDGTTWQRA